MDDVWAHAPILVQMLFPSGVYLPRWGRCAFCCGNDQPNVGEQHESICPEGWICAFPRAGSLARRRLAAGRTERERDADTNCEGDAGRQLAQRESFAKDVDPHVVRKAVRGTTC